MWFRYSLALLGISHQEVSAQDNIFNYDDFPSTVSNTAEPSGEGEMRIAFISDTPFEGTFNPIFFRGAPDLEFIGYFDEPGLTMDINQVYTNDGALEFDIDFENNDVHFNLEEGVLWHDGVEATIHDYVAAYEVIGHPDYNGAQGLTSGFLLIEGYQEYRGGEADSISGIEVIDDYNVIIHYEELPPSLLSGGFWSYLFPQHHYEGVPIDEMAEADQTRVNPIGIGPYKVASITPGESVVYERFDDY